MARHSHGVLYLGRCPFESERLVHISKMQSSILMSLRTNGNWGFWYDVQPSSCVGFERSSNSGTEGGAPGSSRPGATCWHSQEWLRSDTERVAAATAAATLHHFEEALRWLPDENMRQQMGPSFTAQGTRVSDKEKQLRAEREKPNQWWCPTCVYLHLWCCDCLNVIWC